MSADADPEPTPPPTTWADAPGLSRRILLVLGCVCALLFVSDLLYHKHSHFEFEDLLGFHGLFGFAAYVTIVSSAKLLRQWVRRPEGYYDE